MKILFYKEIDSTQNVAYKLALQGEPEGTVVVSDYQTAGRGKLGSKWFASPQKSILCSFILRPPILARQTFLLTRLAAKSVKEGIEKKTNLPVQFKYPNDLLINGKKIAGLLSETRVKGENLEFIILGIGINVNMKKDNLLKNATSLKEEAKRSFSRPALLREITRRFWEGYSNKTPSPNDQ